MSIFAEGLVVSVIGILTVMTVLCVMAIILSFFKYLNVPEKSNNKTVETETKPLKAETEVIEKDNQNDDLELIAVITATIAESMNTSTDKLVVRSFHKVSSWNKEAIYEQQNNSLY